MNIKLAQETTQQVELRLEMYTLNKTFYTFFFTITNYKTRHQMLFALRKNKVEVFELSENNREALFQEFDKTFVTVFLVNSFKAESEPENLAAYTKEISITELLTSLNEEQLGPNVKLNFERVMDNRQPIDFLPIIYQV
jgi:hypothetical protein